MESHPHPLAVKLVPTLTDFAFLSPIVIQFFLGGGAPALLRDGDTGWHIRTGEWILAHGSIPRQDLYSFTKGGQPWFAWEWLWDVAAAALHARWGLAAVVVASTLMLCLTAAIVYRIICARGVNPLIGFGVTVLACLVSSLHWLARPHLVSLLLIALFWLVLEKSAQGRLKLLFLLPVLTVLWANLHGGFLAGVGLIGVYAAAEVLAVVRGVGATAALRRSLPYLTCAAACLLASLVNPYGYRLVWHIVRYLADPFYTQTIAEFMPISFGDFGSLLFEVMMIIGIVGAIGSLGRGRFSDFILVLGWLHLALRSARHVPLFAMVSAPVIALTLEEWLTGLARAPVAGWLRGAASGFQSAIAELTNEPRIERFRLASVLGVLGIAYMVGSAASPPKFHADFYSDEFPVEAADFLRRNRPQARVFSTDRWGGYLIYRTYPSGRVYIDGRSDFYGPAFVREYLDVLALKPGWQRRLAEHGVDTVVLPAGAPLADALAQEGGWESSYRDDVAVVFERR
ncbi:MAG: hypothetical protein ACE141_14690 [Bryobacteraceae bacterium]